MSWLGLGSLFEIDQCLVIVGELVA